MLSVEQTIPFIRHEDPLVVDLALHYLEWVRWPTRMSGDFLLEPARQGDARLRCWLAHFTPSADVLAYAIAAIETREEDKDQFWPCGVIARAPDELFTPDVVAAVARLPIHVRWAEKQTHHRLELMGWSTERLQTRFLEACKEANAAGSAMSEHAEIAALADRLVYRPESHEWARQQLSRFLRSDDWTEVWLFALLVKARWQPVFDLVIERFLEVDIDNNESLFDESADAMSELCDASHLDRLAALWERADAMHRTRLIAAASRLRIPEAEPLLLRFARETDDATDRTFAAQGLCEMLCTGEESYEFIRDLTDREVFDIQQCDLEELAIPLGIMTARPFAEERRWRERIADPRQRDDARQEPFRERYPDLARAAELLERLERLKAENAALEREKDELLAARAAGRNPTERKVGRNDPCPCGSGKKYKKCCLK